MKKILIAAIAATVLSSYGGGHNMYAQTLLPPIHPEYINPIATPPGSGIVSNVPHLSCYSYESIDFQAAGVPPQKNNLYVWAWGAINTDDAPCTGIGWKRTTVGGSIINDGYILLRTKAFEPEVAFIQSDGQTLVYLAYYGYGIGHVYDVYRWDAGTLTLLLGAQPLPGATVYSRISIDAHDLNKLAIVWQTPTGLKLKLFSSTSGSVISSSIFTIAGTGVNSRIPDIAFNQTDTSSLSTKLRVVYVNATTVGIADQDIEVISQNFDALFSAGAGAGALVWSLDNTNGAAYTLNNMVTAQGVEGNRLQLDCPDHTIGDAWSYIYTPPTPNKITARIQELGGGIVDVTTLDYHLDYTPKGGLAIAYDADPRIIHYGWADGIGGRNFLGVSYNTNGIKIGGLDEYKIVQNPPFYWQTIPLLSYSKQNDHNKSLFAVYNMAFSPTLPHSGDLRTKLIPYLPFHTFSSRAAQQSSFYLSANPSSTAPQLLLHGNAAIDKLTLTITDASGKRIGAGKGILSDLNTILSTTLQQQAAGLYFINIVDHDSSKMQVLKFTKL